MNDIYLIVAVTLICSLLLFSLLALSNYIEYRKCLKKYPVFKPEGKALEVTLLVTPRQIKQARNVSFKMPGEDRIEIVLPTHATADSMIRLKNAYKHGTRDIHVFLDVYRSN